MLMCGKMSRHICRQLTLQNCVYGLIASPLIRAGGDFPPCNELLLYADDRERRSHPWHRQLLLSSATGELQRRSIHNLPIRLTSNADTCATRCQAENGWWGDTGGHTLTPTGRHVRADSLAGDEQWRCKGSICLAGILNCKFSYLFIYFGSLFGAEPLVETEKISTGMWEKRSASPLFSWVCLFSLFSLSLIFIS